MQVHTALVSDGRRSLGRTEFVLLMALLMAITALSVDLMLPALGAIREDFGLDPDSTAVAGLVTAYILGMSVSQLMYGILSDRFGRKPLIYVGLTIYLAGAIASVVAPSLGLLLAARFVWGLGAAGPRVLTLSIVRDTHEGSEMARLMSFILAIFILVPVVAPSLGAVLTGWVSWRGTFVFAALVAVIAAIWAIRLPETLRPENRREIGMRSLLASARLVLTNRVTVMSTMALTVLFGAFLSYLASSELIFSDVFGEVDRYPLLFGAIAAVIGVGLLVNGWLVGRFGLTRLVNMGVVGYTASASLFAILGALTGGRPDLWAFMLSLALIALFQSLLIPNLNTLAMIPMGAVAGLASAIIGTVSTGLAAVVGAVIDQTFDGTLLPLSMAFAVAAWLTFALIKGARIETVDDRRVGTDAPEVAGRSPAILPGEGAGLSFTD